MKLRIRGDSVRLRVSQGELAQFLTEGEVADQVRFPDGQALGYRLLHDSAAAFVSAELAHGALIVRVPDAEVDRWRKPDIVGFSGEQALADGPLRILVEKDFSCLAPREGEDDSDTFPNPNAG